MCFESSEFTAVFVRDEFWCCSFFALSRLWWETPVLCTDIWAKGTARSPRQLDHVLSSNFWWGNQESCVTGRVVMMKHHLPYRPTIRQPLAWFLGHISSIVQWRLERSTNFATFQDLLNVLTFLNLRSWRFNIPTSYTWN